MASDEDFSMDKTLSLPMALGYEDVIITTNGIS